ncbi:MAG: hypothetical protein AW07_01340 [Candidatus Accumulibacter sp. SK-11]|nr:MAG: hypothetical protein AW07_01340 [Candidatus Accumulibacter sp. SK-11]
MTDRRRRGGDRLAEGRSQRGDEGAANRAEPDFAAINLHIAVNGERLADRCGFGAERGQRFLRQLVAAQLQRTRATVGDEPDRCEITQAAEGRVDLPQPALKSIDDRMAGVWPEGGEKRPAIIDPLIDEDKGLAHATLPTFSCVIASDPSRRARRASVAPASGPSGGCVLQISGRPLQEA